MGKAILDYVDNYSGGADPIFLQEIEDFGESLENKRKVGTQQVRLLSSLKLSAAPLFVTGCYKAAMASPEAFARQNSSTLFTSSDTNAMQGNLKP